MTLREFDTTNPAARRPVQWQTVFVCRYCGVDFTNVKWHAKLLLEGHVEKYHRHTTTEHLVQLSQNQPIIYPHVRIRSAMQIADIKEGMRKVDVEGIISQKGDVRSVSLKTGGEANVVSATLKDKSGEIALSLWDAQTETAVGAKVRIANGYATAFRGALQITVGRFGTLTVLPAKA